MQQPPATMTKLVAQYSWTPLTQSCPCSTSSLHAVSKLVSSATCLEAPTVRLAAFAAVGGALVIGLSQRRLARRSGVARRAVPTAIYESKQAVMERERKVAETVMNSSPVPQSFQEAMSWAAGACLKGIDAQLFRQSMFFNSGDTKEEKGGELGNVLQFALEFATTMCNTKLFKQRAGDGVRLIFPDFGSHGMATQVLGSQLPKNLTLDYFPSYTFGAVLSEDAKMKFAGMLNSGLLVVVAPTQLEAPALVTLLKVMEIEKKNLPVVLMNPMLGNRGTDKEPSGALGNQLRLLTTQVTPVFHLENIAAPKNSELNPSVICRVWPRPFSAWEDNPDDPEAVDGYFLLDVNERTPQNREMIMELLAMSRELFGKLRDNAPAGPATVKTK